MFSKGSKKGSSKNPDKISGIDDSQIKEDDAESAYADPSVPSPDSLATDTTITRPHTSGGSSTNIDASSIMPALASTPTKRNTMTPEKMRLMKAMKLREKNKQAKEEVPQQQEVIPTVDITEIPVTPSESHFIEEASDDHDTSEMLGTSDNGSLSQFSMSKADSAIDVASSPAPDFASVDTQLESHPPSPMPMSPDIGHSTKASSVSGSTDGTVQELLEDKSFEEKSVEERGFEERLDNLDFKNEDAGFPNAKDTYEDADQLDDSRNGHEEEVDKVSEQMLGAASDRRATEITGNFSTEEVVVHEQPAPLAPRSRFAALPSQPMPQAQPDLHVSPGVNESVPGPALPSTQELRIPTSRFATRDSDTASALPVPIIIAPTAEVAPGDTDGSDNVPRLRRKAVIEPIRTDLNNPSDVEAVRADANLSDDEDLMDELQSATLEQAKPMTVSKSPITSVFPTSSPPKSTRSHTAPPRIVRTASNPIRGPLLVPGDVTASSARAVSTGAAFLHKITQQPSANLTPKKTNIGSSISQRIKALEQLHTTSGPATEGPTRTDRPSSTFFSVRKTIAREPSRSPSVIERASSLSRNQTPSPPQSRDASPETAKLALRDRSGSMASRLSIFEGGNAPRGRPESIQVTARIVREPGQMFPKYQEPSADSTDLTPLDLKQSPLVVDHKRAAGTVPVPTVVKTQETSKQASIPNRTTSEEKRRSQSEDRMAQDMDDGESQLRPRRRSSLTIVRDFIKDRRGSLRGGKSPSTDNLGLGSPLALISPSKSLSRPPSVHTTTGFGRRLSISSRRSSLSKDRDLSAPTPPMPMSPSLMTEAGGSGDESKSPPPGEAGQKKSSRTSRFMRRLSSSLVAGRKNSTPTISPTLAEVEDEAELSDMLPSSRGASASGPVVVSYMGDVNVQFPDNLLWKRRAMCLDSHGFLILNAAQGVTASSASVSGREKQAGAIKRYHLSDFRMPYAPEIEVQELPNSVCLDFVDGSGLQIACEDRAGQLNVLHSEYSCLGRAFEQNPELMLINVLQFSKKPTRATRLSGSDCLSTPRVDTPTRCFNSAYITSLQQLHSLCFMHALRTGNFVFSGFHRPAACCYHRHQYPPPAPVTSYVSPHSWILVGLLIPISSVIFDRLASGVFRC